MHARTRLFSLVGRRFTLHKPCFGYTQGTITAQIDPARFDCHLMDPRGKPYVSMGQPITMGFNRSEFILPPLPRCKRRAEWLEDDYEGFVYKGNPLFV